MDTSLVLLSFHCLVITAGMHSKVHNLHSQMKTIQIVSNNLLHVLESNYNFHILAEPRDDGSPATCCSVPVIPATEPSQCTGNHMNYTKSMCTDWFLLPLLSRNHRGNVPPNVIRLWLKCSDRFLSFLFVFYAIHISTIQNWRTESTIYPRD